ncbi:MAG: class I SAM-dependent methyltransferase, partial [Bacteroidales bacterium]|nr:class I SAM-dependent methyltransferase [Bacteroidales bacterium]
SGNRGAYEYLPASVLHFPLPNKFIPMMYEAGFSQVMHNPLTLGICRMYIGIK